MPEGEKEEKKDDAAASWRALELTDPPGEGTPAQVSGTTLALLPVLSDRIDGSGNPKFVASGCPLFPTEWEPGADVQVLD